jgi:hypothetical protein
MLLTHELQQEHGLARLRIEYQTTAPLDRVRRHYRVMLRRHGWFVGDVEYRDDRWDIAANRGGREASVELRAEGTGTDVRVEISWPTQAVPGGGDQGGPGGGGDQGGPGGGDDHSGPGGGPGGGGGSDHSGPGG